MRTTTTYQLYLVYARLLRLSNQGELHHSLILINSFLLQILVDRGGGGDARNEPHLWIQFLSISNSYYRPQTKFGAGRLTPLWI